MSEAITEKTVKAEYTAEDCDIGGNLAQRLNPALMIESGIKSRTYLVKEYKGAVKTEKYGLRAEWLIIDLKTDDEYIMSSWSFICKDKMTATSLVGKTIKLSPKNDKRCILEILENN